MKRAMSFGMAAALMAACTLPLTYLNRNDVAMIRSVVPVRRRVVRRRSNGGAGRLNRSRHWKSARSYAHARSISPVPQRPVR